MTITIATVDDHPLIRQSVHKIFQDTPDMQVLAEGEDGEAALRVVTDHQPDILFLDMNMPQSKDDKEAGGYSATNTVGQLTQTAPNTAVIMLTHNFVPILVELLIERGAKGYILKQDMYAETLIEAIQVVRQGEVYYSPSVIAEFDKK